MDHNYYKFHTDDLMKKGVLMNEYGLLKPDLKKLGVIKKKIFPNLVAVKHQIDQLRNLGEHIIYLPGSYDLTHIGHAFYVQKTIAWYLSLPENISLTRADIIVLLLVDDDDLISSVKSSKWVGLGGTELFQRPIQSDKIFRTIYPDTNSRLLELASMPEVDLICFLPSPTNASFLIVPEVLHTQKDSREVSALFEDFKNRTEIPERDVKELEKAIKDYGVLVDLCSNDYLKFIEIFKNKTSLWSIQSWQLFIHQYLGFGVFLSPLVRIVSQNDNAYRYQVDFLMEISGIESLCIEDKVLVSTTELLAKYGHEKLIEAKKKNYI